MCLYSDGFLDIYFVISFLINVIEIIWVLLSLCCHLHVVDCMFCSFIENNKMSSMALAIVFGPNFFR